MKTRIIKLPNGKFVLEAKRFFWGWLGVNLTGEFEGRKMFFGLVRNLCWSHCWCDTKEQADARIGNLNSY